MLLTYIVESLLGDQWACFGWGAAGIIAMMTIAYRSLRIGLIALVPNLLPIVLVVGTMGWLDLPINIGTAMISSVSMGLTVDASIFYISSFRRMQSQGMDFWQRLRCHAARNRAGPDLLERRPDPGLPGADACRTSFRWSISDCWSAWPCSGGLPETSCCCRC